MQPLLHLAEFSFGLCREQMDKCRQQADNIGGGQRACFAENNLSILLAASSLKCPTPVVGLGGDLAERSERERSAEGEQRGWERLKAAVASNRLHICYRVHPA